jgi:hypothetical protein
MYNALDNCWVITGEGVALKQKIRGTRHFVTRYQWQLSQLRE